MSIEEAENILNEVIITEPSINSYTYISAEEINKAIDKILEQRLKEETKIKELEKEIMREKIKLESIIKEKEREIKNLKNIRHKAKGVIKLMKYIKKLIKPTVLLEN